MEPKTIQLTLTENEASVLLHLIDLAIKSGGLNVAEAAVVLVKKIQESEKTDKSE